MSYSNELCKYPAKMSLAEVFQDDGFGNYIKAPESTDWTVRLFIYEDLH